MTIVCPSCGAANDDTRRFCAQCGAELLTAEPQPGSVTAVLPFRRDAPAPTDHSTLLARLRLEGNPVVDYVEQASSALTEATELASRFAAKERRLTLLTIVATFLAAGLGVVVTVTGWATLAIVPGVLSAAVGAITTWGKSLKWGKLADANRRLARALDRELTALTYGTGPYKNQESPGTLFVERCEATMDEIHDLAYDSP